MMIDMHVHRSPLALFDIYHGEAEALMTLTREDIARSGRLLGE